MSEEQNMQDTGHNRKSPKIPDVVPVIPVSEVTLFPHMVLPLVVQGQQWQALVDEAMGNDRLVGLLLSKEKDTSAGVSRDSLHTIGTIGLILKMAKPEEKVTQLLVQGITRFRVREYMEPNVPLHARVEPLFEQVVRDREVTAMMTNLVGLFHKVLEMSPYLARELGPVSNSLEDGGMLADLVVANLNVDIEQKQKILEIMDVKDRLKTVIQLTSNALEVLELGQKIQSQVKKDMDKTQRDFYLRQQLKAIREELGEKDEEKAEVEEYRNKIAEKNLPEEAKKEAERELKRLERMHPSSAEYAVVTTYLDWITALPWHESTQDVLDMRNAKKILDDDHYDLEKVKQRIIEYLAVRKLKSDAAGPILCFVGPPGTGKTSLGRSIARALGRKFARMSLGGVRDEAEIRGHRRTYVGALPGRIIQEIRRAGSNNPVFILDEIDKVGTDFRGDPSSALLEVLDPEQNSTFSDHYLDVPFDLSKVMFITTANILDTVPPALKDRMEVLSLPGYTEDEKVQIAKSHLIPRQREAHGLRAGKLAVTAGALRHIITGYTREAGLRNLEREIAAICRGTARMVAEGQEKAIRVTIRDVARYLGPVRFRSEVKARTAIPGVAAGLAWTQTGGDLLFVEATKMKGRQALTLTGQLGEVMKESATAALSYIRSHAMQLGLGEDFFKGQEIHIHVPAGAIPKDGPSAGVTMLSALYSLLSGKTIANDLAMTGEITLRGQVLPVGGIKEKVLAAHRAGIQRIILPKWNEKDLVDVPKNVQKEIAFTFVESADEVLKNAFQ